MTNRCKHWDCGWCYNPGLRNGLNSLACVGSDKCDVYKAEHKISRIDLIGQSGPTGEHYESDNKD